MFFRFIKCTFIRSQNIRIIAEVKNTKRYIKKSFIFKISAFFQGVKSVFFYTHKSFTIRTSIVLLKNEKNVF